MNALLLFLTGGPLAASLTLFLLGKRLRKEAIHWAGLSLLGATLLSALILFWAAEGQAVLHFVWSPWVEPMGLEASATGLLAIMVTAVCGLFALWYGPSLQNRGSPALALWMIALSASNMAFLATHFALRYVALELVALVIPLSLWSEGGETRVGPLARSYLLLRLGDAGFLSGILMLAHAVGTLNIPAALAAAGQLSPGQLGYVSAGLALAVWVKMGMWPLHSWHLDGHKTSLPTRAWLYSIVPANLGLYLLYRITPLLALSSFPQGIFWLAMGSAAISAFLALASHDDRRTLTYLNSALGGLALGLGAAGLVLPVWLCVVMLSSIKMLFFLASDLAVSAEPKSRKTGIGLVAVGSVAMAGLGLITVQWLPPAQVWKYTAIELAWAATAVAGLALAYRLWRAFSPQFSKATGVSPSQPGPVSQPQHIVAWLLGGLLVFEIVDFKDAMGLVARAAHLAFPTLPTWPELLLQALGSPLLWGMALFSLAAWAHQRRLEVGYVDETEGLSSERLDVADRLVTATAKLTMKSAGKTREIIEHGLDQTLHGLARLALAWGKAGQRLHTGRLRVNLIWVALSLALAAAVALAAWR